MPLLNALANDLLRVGAVDFTVRGAGRLVLVVGVVLAVVAVGIVRALKSTFARLQT